MCRTGCERMAGRDLSNCKCQAAADLARRKSVRISLLPANLLDTVKKKPKEKDRDVGVFTAFVLPQIRHLQDLSAAVASDRRSFCLLYAIVPTFFLHVACSGVWRQITRRATLAVNRGEKINDLEAA